MLGRSLCIELILYEKLNILLCTTYNYLTTLPMAIINQRMRTLSLQMPRSPVAHRLTENNRSRHASLENIEGQSGSAISNGTLRVDGIKKQSCILSVGKIPKNVF